MAEPQTPPEVIPDGPLRSGWTTGACATAATRAAVRMLFGDAPAQTVTITLPKGQTPTFDLIETAQGHGWARAAVIKDAGDDPDVTHGAKIIVTVRHTVDPAQDGYGVVFRAGVGVGTVTKPGLPLPPGEPAINPVPRQMICREVALACEDLGLDRDQDLTIEVSIPNGEALAAQTWNPRLGILGGLSILGTTGVVVPYSCAAWIHSIQRGIDVARACGLTAVVGCVGKTSEKAAMAHLGLGPEAMIDMGDFAGGMLKYLRAHPVAHVILSGGFAKLCKLAQGHRDLHSRRSQVDLAALASALGALGGTTDLVEQARTANTALEVLRLAQAADLPLGQWVAETAQRQALEVLDGAPVAVGILAVDRTGTPVGWAKPIGPR